MCEFAYVWAWVTCAINLWCLPLRSCANFLFSHLQIFPLFLLEHLRLHLINLHQLWLPLYYDLQFILCSNVSCVKLGYGANHCRERNQMTISHTRNERSFFSARLWRWGRLHLTKSGSYDLCRPIELTDILLAPGKKCLVYFPDSWSKYHCKRELDE